jgi:acetyl esterase/lipase
MATTEVYATNVDAGGTDLRWLRTVPTSGGPTWPAAVVVHGGNYKSLAPGPISVAQDVANAGYLSLAIEHREAPPHTAMSTAGPPGDPQADPPSDGRPPQQTDDVQRAIRAARAHSQCNGKVAMLGFSSGGAHCAWWAISGSANDDQPDAVVTCSGSFDLDNADLLASAIGKTTVQNYINHLVTEGQPFIDAAKAASPYWLSIGSTPPPILIFNSTAETIPQSVYSTMVTKMTNAGGTVESHLRTGTEHSEDYWYLGYGGSFSTVKDCSIDFLDRMLSVTAVATAPAAIILRRK